MFSQKLEDIPGIGPLTASALVASIGDAKQFSTGRQLAAWLGLVPRQYSAGGKPKLLGISKRGDSYLRTLLIHGARSELRTAHRKSIGERWLNHLVERRHRNIAAVALANKNARIVWALLVHNRTYDDNCQRRIKAAHLEVRTKSWTIQRGSSCIRTRIGFELCGSTSSLVNDSA